MEGRMDYLFLIVLFLVNSVLLFSLFRRGDVKKFGTGPNETCSKELVFETGRINAARRRFKDLQTTRVLHKTLKTIGPLCLLEGWLIGAIPGWLVGGYILLALVTSLSGGSRNDDATTAATISYYG